MSSTAALTPDSSRGFVMLDAVTGTTIMGDSVAESFDNLKNATELSLEESPMKIVARSIMNSFQDIKEDPAAPCFLAYFIIGTILSVGSWLHIRSRPTPQGKKRWFDRWCIFNGIFVAGFMCLILVIWKHYVWIPLFLAAGLGITFLNLRHTYFCGSCGKRSESQKWFSDTFHCPHCGTQLR